MSSSAAPAVSTLNNDNVAGRHLGWFLLLSGLASALKTHVEQMEHEQES